MKKGTKLLPKEKIVSFLLRIRREIQADQLFFEIVQRGTQNRLPFSNGFSWKGVN